MSDRHSISPYPIRMPPDLRDRLEASARDGNRSLHAEIIARLAASYADEERGVPGNLPLKTVTIASLEEMEERMERRLEKHLKVLMQATDELARKKAESESSPE